MTTNDADCSSHDRYSTLVVLPVLLVLEWTESRPLRPTRLPEVPRNRKIQHCHHHHGTAQITPQVTTGGADPSPYGRSSISVVPPRLRCSGRLRAGRYGPRRRRLPCLYMATLPKGNAVLALGLLRAAKAAGCFCECIWWWPYTRTAQGGCCDHGGATAPPCSAYPLLYSHTLTLCTAARYLFRYGCTVMSDEDKSWIPGKLSKHTFTCIFDHNVQSF